MGYNRSCVLLNRLTNQMPKKLETRREAWSCCQATKGLRRDLSVGYPLLWIPAEYVLSVCEVGWTPSLAGFQSLACVLSTQFVPDLLSSVRPRWKETRELWKWPSRKPLWGHSQTGPEIICQDLVVTVFSCQWLQWGWGRGLQMYGRKSWDAMSLQA